MATKDFNKLTTAERRIAIARDVLAHMEAGLIDANYNGYLATHSEQGTLREQVLKGGCRVCAMGALYAGYLLASGEPGSEGETNLLGSDEFSIRGVFSVDELNLVEAVHEGYAEYMRADGEIESIPQDMYHAIITLVLDTTRPERIRRIMENIIDNGGNFDADKLLAPYYAKAE